MADSSQPIDFNKYITGEDALRNATRSARALGKSVADLAKTAEADGTRIKTALAGIDSGLKGLQEKGGKLNLLGPADKALLQEYLVEVGNLAKAKQRLKETEAAQAAALGTLNAATAAQTSALKQQKDALRAAAAANDVEGQRKAAAAIRQTAQENAQLSRAVRGVNSELTAAKGSYDALTLANAKLLAQLRGLEEGLGSTSAQARTLRNQISANTATLTDFDKQVGQNFRNVGNYPKGLQAAGAGALGLVQNLSGVTIGLAGVAQGLNAVIGANVKFSDDAVGVRKTTGLTADEFDRLADSLKGLDTRTSLAGLLEIAKVGGQLGIAKGDILDFTKAVDIGVQALGDDFSGGAEEIATTLGKISNVFKKELGPDVAQNLLAIGSAVNELGAEGAATAPFLTDVALRTGQASAQFGLGLKNALAYAAVLEETGSTSEVAGTSLNRLYSTLGTRTKEAFEIAKKANPALTLKDFTRLVNTDFNAAIQLFLKGLNAGDTSVTEVNKRLGTLKLQSGEAKNAILALAANTDLFAERQKTANDQLRDATSLGEEAALVNDNLAGSVNKAINEISNFFTSGTAGRFLKFFVDFTRNLYAQTIGDTFRAIGNGVDLLQQKLGGAQKPQADFTVEVLANVRALEKQAAAQQQLLDSYTTLAAGTARSEGERLELARVRAKLVAQFGTAEAETIQAGINQQLLNAESRKQVLRQNLANYDKSTTELLGKTAAFQEALTAQEKGFTQQQVARAREAAEARLAAETRTGQPFRRTGAALNPELEPAIAANLRLLRSERDLATQQRTQAQLAAAVAKLLPANTKAVQDGTAATEEAAAAEETLDRAAKARSDARREQLQGELADNQRRIDDLKKFQVAQGKLFEDKQVTEGLFAAAVAGSQDAITQLERDGVALRLRLAREETAGKLVEIDNERIRGSQKKEISAAELADVNAAAATKTLAATRALERQVAAIRREGQAKLEELPIEFRVSKLDLSQSDRDFQRALEQSEKQVDEAGRRQQAALDAEVARVAEAEERKRDLRGRGLEVFEAAAGAAFELQAQNLEAQVEAERLSFERGIANAGENNELREALEAEHQRKQAVLRRKEAENEKRQALFSIILNTAKAVAQDLGRYGLPFALPFIAADVLLGGIQAALVASRPVPQFFKGRRGGEAVPLAEVAERGPELIREAKTDTYRYVAKRAFVPLAAGDDVFTAEETRRIMAGAAADAQQLRAPLQLGSALGAATAAIQAGRVEVMQGGRAGEMQEIRDAMRANTAALGRLKQVTVNVTGEGATAEIRQGSNLVRSLNQRLQNYGG